MVESKYNSDKDNHIIYKLLLLFAIVIMVDPTNNFRLKTPLFAFTLLCSLPTFFSKVNIICYYFLTAILIFVTYGILIAYVYGNNIALDYQIAHVQLLFMSLLIFPLSKLDSREVLKLNYQVGVVLAIFIDILYFAYTLSPEMGNLIYNYIKEDEEIPTILISKRTFLGFQLFAFFFKTAPFLFFATIYRFSNIHSFKDLVIGAILIYPIFLTGSRTPMLCGICILLYCFLNTSKISLNVKILLCLIFVILGICLVYRLIMDPSDASAAVKGGNMQTYVTDIFETEHFFTGWGIGSKFMDIRRRMVTHSEISYFDILRMWGFIIGLLYILFLLYPLHKYFSTKNKNIKAYYVAYLLYLILAGTNPFIFASTGWFILLSAYSMMMHGNVKHSTQVLTV